MSAFSKTKRVRSRSKRSPLAVIYYGAQVQEERRVSGEGPALSTVYHQKEVEVEEEVAEVAESSKVNILAKAWNACCSFKFSIFEGRERERVVEARKEHLISCTDCEAKSKSEGGREERRKSERRATYSLDGQE